MTIAVLIHEPKDAIEEIYIDIDIRKREIATILSGSATFIGQWPELDVVIIKAVEAARENENILPSPFHEEKVRGRVLLVRMDADSEPQDFTKKEYLAWVERRRSP